MKKEEILKHISKEQCVDLIKELFNVYDMKELDIEEIKDKDYDITMLDIADKYFEYNYSEVISYKDDDDLIDYYAQQLVMDDLKGIESSNDEQ